LNFSSFKKRKQKSDLELISDFKVFDDTSAFEELFLRYSHLIFCVCQKYLLDEEESNDATMEIFEKVLKDLKNHKITNFKSWLYATTRNYCNYKVRRKKATNIFDNKTQKNENFFMEFSSFDTLVDEKESQFQNLENAITQLKQRQQECIRLFYYDNKSYRQISESTGYSESQVKSHIQNGKRRLKILLSQNEAFRDV
jgi:RNA polymerase sigma factor (sigma-70 family)